MVPSTAWTYTITSGPDALAVSLDDFKTHLRPATGVTDDELTDILNAAILYGEKYTKRDFITRTYQTLRNELSQVHELRRSKLQSVTHIKYLVGGVQQTVSDSLYYNTIETDFSRIFLEDGESWPTDGDTRAQSVEVEFKAGYGDTEADVPQDIKQAIMQHATHYYENRGDCMVCTEMALASSIPTSAKAVYEQYKIRDVVLGIL